ncbi:alpha/beta hydrolase family protein [Gemmatimonas groenlandica]|uniref:S9 family peptidase n=1 Tax=Gemmatimonas groenlandica TaxID=2732249 RepID=A0A6M4IND1_9BACT|nr:alpha/beta fold hydrolase [Gemmatimonas groenlandica]QJR36504.1 S9 family peptidase [Gemmatimonas groenlandica]
MTRFVVRPLLTLALLAALPALSPAQAQDAPPPRRGVVITDTARARSLFVSKDPADLAGCGANCDRDIKARIATDSAYEARAKGVMEFKKVTYKSRVDGLEIPAYVFAPLTKNPAGHAALVWVHGGVHSNWGLSMWPFVREAVQKGYVVITPNYRGSTGYGNDFHRKIDYGGKEVDDVLSSADYLKTQSFVDMDRLGMMGWSHGAFITALNLTRDTHPFRAGAAMVPVTNLIFRLSDHGPGYQRDYAAEEGIQGLPFENVPEYIRRSPVFQLEKLTVPLIAHVATNDCDVYFRENQQFIYTLRALKPDLAETKIYVNPPQGGGGCGHTFNRRVNASSTQRDDTPEQIDSWNRVWTFFEWNLRPKSVMRVDNEEWKKDPRVASPRGPVPPQ